MLIDASLLIYAVDETAPDHPKALAWLTDRLNVMKTGSAGDNVGLSKQPAPGDRPESASFECISATLTGSDARHPGRSVLGLVGQLVRVGQPDPDARVARVAYRLGALVTISAPIDWR